MYQNPLQKHLFSTYQKLGCAFLLFASCVGIGWAESMPYHESFPPLSDRLNAPAAVAVSQDERIYVAEPSNNRVQVYNRSGQYQATLSNLREPVAVAVGPDGRLYIGEAGSGRVSVYGANLALIGYLGAEIGEFLRPSAIAATADGAIYVADGKMHLVKVYRPDRTFNFTFGSQGTAAGKFLTPTAIAANALTGEILITDLADPFAGQPARVQIFNQSGQWLRTINARVRPLGVAVDKKNRVYVADAYENDVYVYGAQGALLGTLNDAARPFRTPLGMAYAPETGRLFIAALLSASIDTYGIDTSYTRIASTAQSLEFGDVNAGALSAIKRIDISNQGKIDLNIGTAELTGTNASVFFIYSDSCSNKTLVPNTGCSVELLFAPLSSGVRNAKLSIPSSDLYSPQYEVALRGTGLYQSQMTSGGGDGDGDGMADAWELANGFNPWSGTDATGDADGDGFSNLEEYLAGSNPRSAASNPGRLDFASTTYGANENALFAELVISRSGGSAGVASVQCYTINGSALAGSDYTATSLWVTWSDGDMADKSCIVPIIDDSNFEGTEHFQATLTNPAGGVRLGTLHTAEISLTDNDALAATPGQLNFASAAHEVSENSGSAVLVIKRSGGSAGGISVQCSTLNGSAMAGSDYTETTRLLEWGNGDVTDKTCLVQIIDDTSLEDKERFQVMLVNPVGGAQLGAVKTAEVSILDNDANPGQLAFATAAYEANENAGNATLTVRRSGGSAGVVSVQCRTLNGSAVAGSDYTETAQTLEWANGETADKTCTVPITDDADIEEKERFQVTLANPVRAQLGTVKTAEVSILDNDGAKAARNDFNGDGRSDILVRHNANNAWYYYPLNGKTVVSGMGAADLSADSAWAVMGTGDYDGDRKADVLLRHKLTHEWRLYLMDGAQIRSQVQIPDLTNDPDWEMAGSGDFNGDGRADVLLRSASSHRWYLYPLNGAQLVAGAGMPEITNNPVWKMAGVGDFNGDGADDVLLFNSKNGRWYYYALQGIRVLADSAYLPLQNEGRWQLAGIGDFNGDGTDDVLMRNAATQKWYYHPLNGKQALKGRGLVGLSADPLWSVAGIGDYNGDGTTDILLRHGTTQQWQFHPLNGKEILPGGGNVDLTADASWRSASK